MKTIIDKIFETYANRPRLVWRMNLETFEKIKKATDDNGTYLANYNLKLQKWTLLGVDIDVSSDKDSDIRLEVLEK